MAFTQVRLRSHRMFPAVMRQHGKKAEAAIQRAMVKTAQFGVAAVQRTIRQTTPKPYAFGTYSQSWSWKKTKTGAILGTDARHGVFVEVGRRPGKAPPFEAILEWVKIKRLAIPKPVPKPRRAGPGRKKKTKAELELDKAKKGGKGKTGGVPNGRKKPSPAALKKDKAQRAFAFLVQRKIASKGTRGRYVLLRTMPLLKKRADRELRREVSRMLARGRGGVP